MTLRRLLALPLALLCLASAACATGGSARPGEPPDPRTAIVLSVSSEAIYLVDPDTGARNALVRGLVDFQAGFASWAPDHRRLAFGNAGIVIVDAVTGDRDTLVTGQSLSMPAWSPSGRDVVYGDGVEMWVSPVAAHDPEPVEVPETLAPLGMDWGPGGRIAFDGLELDCSFAAGCYSTDLSEVWTIKPDGSGLTRLTDVGHAENPKWSPDGTQILFVRRLGGLEKPRSTELWAVDVAAKRVRQLFRLYDVVAADWSPQGDRIVIVRRGALRTLQLWVANSDGTDLHPIGQQVPGVAATVDW